MHKTVVQITIKIQHGRLQKYRESLSYKSVYLHNYNVTYTNMHSGHYMCKRLRFETD